MMDAQLAFNTIMPMIAQPLLVAGFSRQGLVFRRQQDENWQIIQFQKSVTSSAQRVSFTCNLGVVSARISQFFIVESKSRKPRLENCHWQERIGHLLPQQPDLWWIVDDRTRLDLLAAEISAVLSCYAIPTLERYAHDEQLRDLWLNGEARVFGYLAVLLKALGPVECLEKTLEQWRQLVADRPAAVLVEQEIQRLVKE